MADPFESSRRKLARAEEHFLNLLSRTRSYLPAAAFASSCFSFAIVAAVESFRLPDLWRRFRLVAACPFAMYPPTFFVMAHRGERHGIYLTRHCILALEYWPIFLMKTKLVLAGESKTKIVQATTSALDNKELPALEPGAMCYMMSKRQYLSDRDMSWHPHLMFFIPGNAAKSWGAHLPGSPDMAADDPEERVTIFLVWIGKWSDATPAPQTTH